LRILLWHWGRSGAGPRFALELAEGLRAQPGVSVQLSLPESSEILRLPGAPANDLPVRTYANAAGFVWRLARTPAMLVWLDRVLARLRPELAICAMPALLDPLMLAGLRRRDVPSMMIVHDATPHPGDGGWARAVWDCGARRQADVVAVLSRHVGHGTRQPVLRLSHPPFPMPPMPAPRSHGGPLRVLCFGRWREYKGLALMARTLARLPAGYEVRVVGSGTLPALSRARVENRFVPEHELPALFAWADVVLLTHTEASQSGVAAMGLGAGRFVVSTNVGGLPEQLAGRPGVVLCPPEAEALVHALRTLPMEPPAPINARAAWRDMTANLLALARGLAGVPDQDMITVQPDNEEKCDAPDRHGGIPSGPELHQSGQLLASSRLAHR